MYSKLGERTNTRVPVRVSHNPDDELTAVHVASGNPNIQYVKIHLCIYLPMTFEADVVV